MSPDTFPATCENCGARVTLCIAAMRLAVLPSGSSTVAHCCGSEHPVINVLVSELGRLYRGRLLVDGFHEQPAVSAHQREAKRTDAPASEDSIVGYQQRGAYFIPLYGSGMPRRVRSRRFKTLSARRRRIVLARWRDSKAGQWAYCQFLAECLLDRKIGPADFKRR